MKVHLIGFYEKLNLKYLRHKTFLKLEISSYVYLITTDFKKFVTKINFTIVFFFVKLRLII